MVGGKINGKKWKLQINKSTKEHMEHGGILQRHYNQQYMYSSHNI